MAEGSSVEHPATSPNPISSYALGSAASPVRWIVAGLLPVSAQIILGGSAKLGKSRLAAHLLRCVAEGTSFLGAFNVARRPCLYVPLEGGADRAARRWSEVGAVDQPHLSDHDRAMLLTDPSGIMSSGDPLDGYRRALDRLKTDEVLVVVDPLARVIASDPEAAEVRGDPTNDNIYATRFLSRHEALIHAGPGATWIWIHHFRKSKDTLRGATAWEDASDGWWEAHPTAESGTMRIEVTLRDGPGQIIGARSEALPDGTFAFARVDPPDRASLRARNGESKTADTDRVREVLWQAADAGATNEKIGALTHLSKERIKRVVAELEARREIERSEGHKPAPWRLTVEGRRLMMARKSVGDDRETGT